MIITASQVPGLRGRVATPGSPHAEREGFHRGDRWAAKCLVNDGMGWWTGSNPGSNADAFGREPLIALAMLRLGSHPPVLPGRP